jgi:peptidoglycan/xylan/chitin deacetylase (PgdA/CDA1 family)
VVSLTFDDSTADQMLGAEILARNGVHGTFYVISGMIDTAGYMGRSDLTTLVREGHEVGGHTTNHFDLGAVSAEEARRQICTDRQNLASWGFTPRSFAYPYGAAGPAVAAIVRACGYDSARTSGGIRAPNGCSDCDAAETIPPLDPFGIRDPGSVESPWSLDTLKDFVITAENEGGSWVPLEFHHVCDGCGGPSVRPDVLEAFVKWLNERGTAIKTMGDVIGGQLRPVVPPPDLGSNADTSNGSLEIPGPGDVPYCWSDAGYGDNTPKWTRTRDAHSGEWAERLDVVSYRDGDAKLVPRMDLGECAIRVSEGLSYKLGVWYKSTAPTQYVVSCRVAAGRWTYWTSSPFFGPTDSWTHIEWSTPPIPPGATALSFGLALASTGSLTTDDYHVLNPSVGGVGSAVLIASGVLLFVLFLGLVRRASRSRTGKGAALLE